MVEKYEGALQFVRDAKAPYFEYTKNLHSRQKTMGILERVNLILDDTKKFLVQEEEETKDAG